MQSFTATADARNHVFILRLLLWLWLLLRLRLLLRLGRTVYIALWVLVYGASVCVIFLVIRVTLSVGTVLVRVALVHGALLGSELADGGTLLCCVGAAAYVLALVVVVCQVVRAGADVLTALKGWDSSTMQTVGEEGTEGKGQGEYGNKC